MSNSDTDSFSYSNGAVSVLNEFLDVKFILLVEGPDDIPFWNLQFGRYISEDDYEIRKVDGKKEIDKRIEGILDGSLTQTVVACDSDYTEFQKSRPTHTCIVWTYGHSIENTMFCPDAVAKHLNKWTNTSNDYSQDVKAWVNTFCTSARLLLPYEIKNAVDPTHCTELPKILNDKYHQLKVSDRCSDLDDQKINSHISSFKSKYSSDDIEEISNSIDASSKEMRYLIQGHFLAEGIMEFIREKIKTITGKSDGQKKKGFYVAFSECPRSCRTECPDIPYLRDQIHAVADRFHCTKIS